MKVMHHICEAKSPSMKKLILDEMSHSDCFFEAIYEIINNIYLKNLKIPLSQKKTMRKYLKVLDNIHCRPKSKLKRRKLVNQSGGFLPILLPILTSVVTGLITNAVSKKSNPDSS
jgi:hypothetical protein